LDSDRQLITSAQELEVRCHERFEVHIRMEFVAHPWNLLLRNLLKYIAVIFPTLEVAVRNISSLTDGESVPFSIRLLPQK